MSLETVKCPYCYCVYRTDIEKIFEDGKTNVVRRPKLASVSNPGRDMYVDLTCPNCGEEFEWQKK